VVKSTGRVANRLLNEKLGIGQKQPVRSFAQKPPEAIKSNVTQNNSQDIWSRYGFN
jgi:hypothetical protein